MPTFYSDNMAIRRALEQGTNYTLDDGLIREGGRLHVVYTTWGSQVMQIGDTLELFVLPKRARLIRGFIGTGNLGATTTLGIGTDVALVDEYGVALAAAGPGNLAAAVATSAVALTAFAATRVLGAGGLTTAPTKVIATLAGAASTAGVGCFAWAEYLQN